MDQETVKLNRLNILKYFNKSEEDFERDVNIILTTLKQYAHFPKIPDTQLKQKIEVYLILNKFKMEKIKTKLDFYYTCRNFYPEYFDNWDPYSPEIETTFSIYRHVGLILRTSDLYRVSLIDFTHKIDAYDPIKCMKIVFMSAETQIPYGHIMGDIIVIDCSKININIIKRFTPSIARKSIDICLKGYSIRVASINLVYPPTAISIILNILKVILKPKIYERIYLHDDLESLHQVVPKDYLPKNLGGNLPNIEILADSWYNQLRNNRQNLIDESRLRTDETKRTNELNEDAFFGSMHGTFKKLDFD